MFVSLQKWMSPWGGRGHHPPPTLRTTHSTLQLDQMASSASSNSASFFSSSPRVVLSWGDWSSKGSKSNWNKHSRLRYSQTLSFWFTPDHDDSWGQVSLAFNLFLSGTIFFWDSTEILCLRLFLQMKPQRYSKRELAVELNLKIFKHWQLSAGDGNFINM